jgi:glyoxylase I family protein
LQRLCQIDKNSYHIVFINVFIVHDAKNGKTKSGKETKRQGFSACIGKGKVRVKPTWNSRTEHPIQLYGKVGTCSLSPPCLYLLANATMSFLAIHHVAIICSDYTRSKQFYTQTLGLKIIAEAYRAERQSYKLDLLIADGTQLELFSFPNPPERPSRPEACGLRHLAFAVADVEDIKKDLEQKGVAVEPIRIDEYTGKKFTFFADPDGLPLEVYEVISQGGEI